MIGEENEIGCFLMVGAGKGGVGKSTVAVNLALALRKLGHRVGLLDADTHGPSAPIMLGATERKPESDGEKILPVVAHEIPCMSMGFLVDPGQALIWRGPMLASVMKQLLFDVRWGQLDYLVIDLPPGTGDVPISLSQKVPGAVALLVTTPQAVALADVRRAHAMMSKVDITVLGLIENMSYLRCPHCEGEVDVFQRGGGERAATEMGVPFLGAIPMHPAIRAGADEGNPFVVSSPEGPEGTAMLAIARRVADATGPLAERKATRPNLRVLT